MKIIVFIFCLVISACAGAPVATDQDSAAGVPEFCAKYPSSAICR